MVNTTQYINTFSMSWGITCLWVDDSVPLNPGAVLGAGKALVGLIALGLPPSSELLEVPDELDTSDAPEAVVVAAAVLTTSLLRISRTK